MKKCMMMVVVLITAMLGCATSVDVGTRKATPVTEQHAACPEAKGVMVNVAWGKAAANGCAQGGEISIPFADMLGRLLGQLAVMVPGVGPPPAAPPTVIVNGGTVEGP